MELKEIVNDYVDLLVMFDEAKRKGYRIEFQLLEEEKKKIHNMYINRLYRANDSELCDLKEYLVNLTNELHEKIFQYEQYRNNFFNHVINGDDDYIDKLDRANSVLNNLILRTKKYENIVLGLTDLIKTKIYVKKRTIS